MERIIADPSFMITRDEVNEILKPEKFIGRSREQVEEFLENCVKPVIDANKDILNEKGELTV